MRTYIILLRGINVGGNNTVPMAALKKRLKSLGYADVVTYIASGNAILSSTESAAKIKARVEAALPKLFTLENDAVKVLVLTADNLLAVIKDKPRGFGAQPAKFHSDVIFLMDIAPAQAMEVFKPREGVDRIWPGDGVIYSQRLSAERTKSRLNRIMSSPLYKSMTIRNWNTTVKLYEMVKDREG